MPLTSIQTENINISHFSMLSILTYKPFIFNKYDIIILPIQIRYCFLIDLLSISLYIREFLPYIYIVTYPIYGSDSIYIDSVFTQIYSSIHNLNSIFQQ